MSPRLRNAPVLEAIIDLQGTSSLAGNPDKLLESFKDAHDQFKNDYPTIQQRLERQIKISGGAAEPVVSALLEGFQFRSESPRRVIQFRKNGFTFSLLRPYSNWGDLLAGAQKGWAVYRSIVPDFVIRRVAVRFINQFSVPYPLRDSDRFLPGLPTPSTEPQNHSNIKALVQQTVSMDGPSGTNVGLVRIIQEPATDSVEAPAVIDIDVFRQVDIGPGNDHLIWQILPAFQEVKNRVFFRSIGPGIIEKCGGYIE